MARLYITLPDSTKDLFESQRTALFLTRSEYLEKLLKKQKVIRPPTLKYRELIDSLSMIEKDLRVIAMKDTLPDDERLYIMIVLQDLMKKVDSLR